MPSPRYDAALELKDKLTEIVAADDTLDGVTVTLDAAEVHSAARNGVVLIDVPTLSSENFSSLLPTFEVHVIAGPPTNPLAAWQRIDAMIEALHQGGLNIDRGEPSSFPGKNNPTPIPAYTLTLNE